MKLICYIFLLVSANLLFAQDYVLPNIPTSLYNDANSILVEENISIDIPSYKGYQYDYQGVTLVLNKNGDKHTTRALMYDNEIKIKAVEAIIYDEKGNEVEKLKKRDFIDVSAVDGVSLYTDNRALVLDYTPTTYPYIIKFTYSIYYDDTAFITGYAPVKGYDNSILSSTCSIKSVPNLGFKHKIYDPLNAFTTSINDSQVRIAVKNFGAIQQEDHSSGFSAIEPRALFGLDTFELKGLKGTASSWKAFGKWYHENMLTDTAMIPEATKIKIQQLVSNDTSLVEKARKIYEFMQSQTRYVSVQMGIGGWKPMPANDVDRLGYGDCKGLSNYTKSLMEVAEIPAYYTVVYGDREKRNILSDFSTLQGNHAILAIPYEKDYIWLECTNQDVPFGYLGDFTDDRDVLVIKPEGGEIVHTVKYDTNQNTLLTKGVVTIDVSGGISVTTNLQSEGLQYDFRYRLSKKLWKNEKTSIETTGATLII